MKITLEYILSPFSVPEVTLDVVFVQRQLVPRSPPTPDEAGVSCSVSEPDSSTYPRNVVLQGGVWTAPPSAEPDTLLATCHGQFSHSRRCLQPVPKRRRVCPC